jgi:hypothetical protein
MCAYYQCIASLQIQMEQAEKSDPLQYTKLRKAMLLLDDYMNLYLWAVKCGKESAYWCKKIREILMINVPCDCAQDDDAPHIIVPISGSSGGSPTTSTFVYTFGAGSAGFPVSPHSGDVHQFTSSSGPYVLGDIYQYSGSAWAFEMNVVGPQGPAGTNASGVSAVNVYSDLSSNGTPAGTTNTVLKTYTFPALTMINNGDMLKILGSFIYAQNQNGKLSQLTWGGNVVASNYSDSLINAANQFVKLEAEVNRINLLNQMVNGKAVRGNTIYEPVQTDTAVDLSSSVVITANGQNDVANANDVICDGLTVQLFSMINGAILGSSNIAQGIANTTGGSPYRVTFASPFASANYTISINCYDSEGNPQTFTVPSAYKTVNGFEITTLVNAIVEWTAILQ